MVEIRETIIVRRDALVRKVCATCGREFSGRTWARYCRLPCSQRAQYLRHAEKRRAERRARYWRRKGVQSSTE